MIRTVQALAAASKARTEVELGSDLSAGLVVLGSIAWLSSHGAFCSQVQASLVLLQNQP